MNKVEKSLFSLFFVCILFSINNSYTYDNPSEEIKNELLKKIEAGIPEWMTNHISEELSNFNEGSITKEMIQQTLDLDKEFITKFSIKNNQVTVYTHPGMTRSDYTQPLFKVLQELSTYVNLPDIDILYSVDDAPYNFPNLLANNVPPISYANYLAPVMAPTKHINDKNVITIPDSHTFIFMDAHKKEVDLGNSKYPWEAKQSKAFWRGATTGGIYYPDVYTKFPRVKLVQISTEKPEILDAKFNIVIQDWGTPMSATFNELGYVGSTQNISDHIQYKYQILIDGNSAAWSRGFWQLHCNSVMLKQNSHFVQWYYGLLKPYVHYIPFDYYCSDLVEKIEWAKNNNDEVQKIIKNANELAENCLKYSDMLLYLYAIIINYAKLQASE